MNVDRGMLMQPHLRMRTWLEGVEALRRVDALVGAEDSTKLADINKSHVYNSGACILINLVHHGVNSCLINLSYRLSPVVH